MGNSENKLIIGEATPIRVGLVIAFLAVFAGGVWWASSVNSKLDSIITFQSSTSTAISELRADVSELKLRQALSEKDVKELQNKGLIIPLK